MARGNDAKLEVINRLQEAFGADWIGEVDKKYYVWANENGERLQIAITLTCPKTQVEVKAQSANFGTGNKLDFENQGNEVAISQSQSTEITEEEKNYLNQLMEKLGL